MLFSFLHLGLGALGALLILLNYCSGFFSALNMSDGETFS